jgi:hypothetical protein
MQLHCPNCQAALEDVNAETDAARCANCNEVHKVSELMADTELTENLEPPAGSEISFEAGSGDRAEFFLPRRGFTAPDLLPLAISVLGLGFMAWWIRFVNPTFSPVIRLVCILGVVPFVVVLWLTISGMRESQGIILEGDTLTICKYRPIFSRIHNIPTSEVTSIDIEWGMPKNPATLYRNISDVAFGKKGIPLPTVTHGKRKTHFGDILSKPEREWLVRILKAAVRRQTGRRV